MWHVSIFVCGMCQHIRYDADSLSLNELGYRMVHVTCGCMGEGGGGFEWRPVLSGFADFKVCFQHSIFFRMFSAPLNLGFGDAICQMMITGATSREHHATHFVDQNQLDWAHVNLLASQNVPDWCFLDTVGFGRKIICVSIVVLFIFELFSLAFLCCLHGEPVFFSDGSDVPHFWYVYTQLIYA